MQPGKLDVHFNEFVEKHTITWKMGGNFWWNTYYNKFSAYHDARADLMFRIPPGKVSSYITDCATLFLQRLRHRIPDTSRQIILDVGCGRGFFTTELMTWFSMILGVDSSGIAISKAMDRCRNERNNTLVLFKTLDITEETTDIKANGAVCFNVIDYLKESELKKFVQSIALNVKDKGWIFVSSFGGNRNLYCERSYTNDEISNCAIESGLGTLDVFDLGYSNRGFLFQKK